MAQAILLVGHTRLRVMALSLSLRDSFPFGKAHSLDYEYFWKASLYRALIAQDLYQRTGDILLVKTALRHRSIASTLVYARATDDRIRLALK